MGNKFIHTHPAYLKKLVSVWGVGVIEDIHIVPHVAALGEELTQLGKVSKEKIDTLFTLCACVQVPGFLQKKEEKKRKRKKKEKKALEEIVCFHACIHPVPQRFLLSQ
jgi:hypothetical protein